MTLQSDVKAVFSRAASYLTVSTGYRLKTSDAWGSWLTCSAEIKGISIVEEFDEDRSTTVKRQRATIKVYDTTSADAPVLRLGDEVRQDSVVWTVTERAFADVAAGVYRYAIRRDVPLRSQPERQHLPIAEGGITTTPPTTGVDVTNFNATNVDTATIFFGALVQRTSTGVVLARSDVSGKDAVGICSVAAIVGATATYVTEGTFTTSDWTAMLGSTSLTAGTLYFLSATAGRITATPPTTGWSQAIGTAMSATELDLQIVEPIAL